MGRPPCCDKSNVKRGLWTAEEDAKILAYISTHGTGNWTSVPKKAGLKRCGKSCRLRWTNYLRPDLKHESFTPQEEELIVNLHAAIGSRWSIIADQLPGRTDNDVKNHWNTKLRKKLFEKGIDPITHKPMSQIAAYYQSIGFSKSTKSPTTTSTYRAPKSTPKPMMPNTLTTMNNNNNNNQPTHQEIFYNNHTLYNANLHMISFDEASSSIAPPSLMQDDHNNNDCSGSSSSFSWSDFLLDEELLSPCKDEQPQSQCGFAALNGVDVDGGGCSGFMDEVIVSQGDLNGVGSSSTSLDGSFMEGFYDEDSGMWELAEFLNDDETT